jgi:alkylation response protein AidB-like acyl-CoA dehydrogenase
MSGIPRPGYSRRKVEWPRAFRVREEEAPMIATTTMARELVEPVAEEIRRQAPQAEAERRLPNALFDRLMKAGLFSIYTPKEFGGMDLPLPEALQVVEEVSIHDGSTGWTVALGFANGLFTSVLSDTAAARVLGNGSVLIAGAPAFGVRAVRVDGGYRLTGRWPFNSGAPNAQWIGAPAPIFDGETPRMGESGPEMVFFFLPQAEVQIVDTWYVTGLRASGTQDLYVEDVFVPDEMTGGFSMPAGPHPVRDCTLARIPFFSVIGVAQSPPVCLGLARRAIDEFKEIALAKENPFGPRMSEQAQVYVGLARAEGLLRSARTYWYEQVEAAWEAALQGREFSPQDRVSLRLASLMVVENTLAAADALYRLAGTSSIFQSSPLERCWRDIHTAAQHMQVQHGRWETAGRVLLGLEPDSPIL